MKEFTALNAQNHSSLNFSSVDQTISLDAHHSPLLKHEEGEDVMHQSMKIPATNPMLGSGVSAPSFAPNEDEVKFSDIQANPPLGKRKTSVFDNVKIMFG